MAEVNQFFTEPITCYAQSGSAQRLALSPNNNLVHIYKQKDSSWLEETILEQHDLRVTSIDWAPKSDRIVTCSADRNAYVWIQSPEGIWKPTLVLLRINRAATCVKWSPNEDKFAVGTAAKLICVCYFESANDWWLSRHIKKPIKSTVTCLDWHPNSILLACGSTDYKSRIFSTYIKEVDQQQQNSSTTSATSTTTTTTTTNTISTNGDMMSIRQSSWLKNRKDLLDENSLSTTGLLVNEFSNSGAWVHDVSFSRDGTKLAWVSHDSSISVVDSAQSMTVVTLKTRYLPFLSCVWVSQSSLVAAGHDCCPMLFQHVAQTPSQNPMLKFVGRLDRSQKREADGQSAMRKFRDLDSMADQNMAGNHQHNLQHHHSTGAGQAQDAEGNNRLGTIHQNTIGQIRVCAKSQSVVTAGLDGKLVVWSLDPSVL